MYANISISGNEQNGYGLEMNHDGYQIYQPQNAMAVWYYLWFFIHFIIRWFCGEFKYNVFDSIHIFVSESKSCVVVFATKLYCHGFYSPVLITILGVSVFLPFCNFAFLFLLEVLYYLNFLLAYKFCEFRVNFVFNVKLCGLHEFTSLSVSILIREPPFNACYELKYQYGSGTYPGLEKE